MKRFALLALAIPALLGFLTTPAGAEPPPVLMHMVGSAASGADVIVAGQLTDRQTGEALSGYRVCLTFQDTTGAADSVDCEWTDPAGDVKGDAPEGESNGAIVRFRWECDGDGYQALSYWTPWYRADPGGWTQVSQ